MSKILILDTETTGLIEPIQPVEMAWIELDSDLTKIKELGRFERRYKPDKPIEFGAMATSHILEEELQNEISYTQCIFDVPEATEYLIGQNIDYDWKVLGKPPIKRICTKALSTWLFPGLDSYSQSALLYYCFGREAKPLLKEAHNAMCDIENNLRLFKVLVNSILYTYPDLTIETLWELSEEARIPTVVPFGKFKGQPFNAMDIGYVQWWLYKSDTKPDEYQLKALRKAGFKV
jgi:exodeoxyribonuclease X